MMYALGRELEAYDMPQVRAVVRRAAAQDHRLSAIVSGIVSSDAFRMQAPPRGRGPRRRRVAKRGLTMFLTKQHLSRRTVLKGAGVALALPLLDAMIPAATALAQTAAAPKLRMGFFYIPHGAIMGNTSHGPRWIEWTPSGAGADFKLSPILAPLEPYKQLRHVVREPREPGDGRRRAQPRAGHLAERRPAGQGVARAPAWPTTLDQVVAQHIGQDTTLPSLEVASETTQQAAACSGSACFYNTTLSFRDAHSPLPMEFNPRKVFAQLFGEGDTPEERAAIASQTRSLLDRITRPHAARCSAIWARAIARVLDDYLDTVREIERRVQLASSRDLSAIDGARGADRRAGRVRRAGRSACST